ncbi:MULTISPECIES: hypothetical protein [Corynebacterium]|uniref:Uncharacterized protein n=1 Tax=Corynebacterium flavescens TaxID=28028 RepID=A0AB73BAA3_CORFL|nr:MULTISPECIES: hypothetical protein [Corynebacterium]GEB98702.1 hypothetical protein CFL01nite_21970 [Corynebacterium flavescens]
MQLPNFDENSTNLSELVEAFEVFEYREEHLLNQGLLFGVFAS